METTVNFYAGDREMYNFQNFNTFIFLTPSSGETSIVIAWHSIRNIGIVRRKDR